MAWLAVVLLESLLGGRNVAIPCGLDVMVMLISPQLVLLPSPMTVVVLFRGVTKGIKRRVCFVFILISWNSLILWVAFQFQVLSGFIFARSALGLEKELSITKYRGRMELGFTLTFDPKDWANIFLVVQVLGIIEFSRRTGLLALFLSVHDKDIYLFSKNT